MGHKRSDPKLALDRSRTPKPAPIQRGQQKKGRPSFMVIWVASFVLGVLIGSCGTPPSTLSEAPPLGEQLETLAVPSPAVVEQFEKPPLDASAQAIQAAAAQSAAAQSATAQSAAAQTPRVQATVAQAPRVNPPLAQNASPLAQGLPTPPYELLWADTSNYGERYSYDINGTPVYNQPIIVLHETVYSADSAINLFRTHHTDESQQASYHTLIRLNGTVVYVVPPEKRAFGAGNSVFMGANGAETVKTHKSYPPSVNNFAYHISLETPYDGQDEGETHSGYTEAQYRSLAWLVAQSSVPDDRITTHRAVDRSQSRIDPRSFDQTKFFTLLHQLRGVR